MVIGGKVHNSMGIIGLYTSREPVTGAVPFCVTELGLVDKSIDGWTDGHTRRWPDRLWGHCSVRNATVAPHSADCSNPLHVPWPFPCCPSSLHCPGCSERPGSLSPVIIPTTGAFVLSTPLAFQPSTPWSEQRQPPGTAGVWSLSGYSVWCESEMSLGGKSRLKIVVRQFCYVVIIAVPVLESTVCLLVVQGLRRSLAIHS